jgi:hypothetical protein
MSTILFSLVALAASAAATEQVNVFVCDHQNKLVSLQAFSHGQLARICIQPTESDMSIQGLDSLLFLQHEQGDVEEIGQLAVTVGRWDASMSDLYCKEDLCVVKTYLLGDFFLSGGSTLSATGVVNLKKKQTSQLRGNQPDELIMLAWFDLTLEVQTNPLPAKVNYRAPQESTSSDADVAEPLLQE